MATLPEPVYFELSWSVLSTIGAANVFFGVFVVSITNFSPIATIPIVTSAAAAVANGLCFYAFYLASEPLTNQAVASVFADIFWLIQEAGLSFYSYVILSRILSGKQWYTFASLFWTIMAGIVSVRIAIAVTRVRFLLHGDSGSQDLVNHLHMAYFPLIAVLECISAYHLLTVFAEARMNSLKRATKTELFHYLMRSTEIRMALLAVVGIMRSVTYSFQATAQSATNTASQLDRFAYTMECLFPIMMYMDMLSSKIVSGKDRGYDVSPRSRLAGTPRTRRFVTNAKDDQIYGTTSQAGHEQAIEITGGAAVDTGHSRPGRSSSQERIIHHSAPSIGMAPSDVELEAMEPDQSTGISKRVEFEVRVSQSRTGNRSPSTST